MQTMTEPKAAPPASRPASHRTSFGPAGTKITNRQRQVLDFIEQQMRERGYPPSVREIGEAIGLTSPSTVHSHLNTLQRLGFLRRDPTKPRAIEVRWDPNSGAAMERRPVRHVPLVGDVAAGTDVLAEENVEELLPVPADFTGEGELFMLRVRGDSMIDAGILDGDFVVVAQQPTASNGDIVVAGIPGGEATVKQWSAKAGSVTLTPANATMQPMVFPESDVDLYGKVVTVMRRL
jgi:repressor LexA